MNRRQFLAVSSGGVVISAGCLAASNGGDEDQDSPPSIDWKTSEGHTDAHGGDRLVYFEHEGGNELDTTDSTLEPVHDGEGVYSDERDVSFMHHTSGNTYTEGDELIVVIPESEPQIEFGERFDITWTTPSIAKNHTIGEHLWGQNYRNDVP